MGLPEPEISLLPVCMDMASVFSAGEPLDDVVVLQDLLEQVSSARSRAACTPGHGGYGESGPLTRCCFACDGNS